MRHNVALISLLVLLTGCTSSPTDTKPEQPLIDSVSRFTLVEDVVSVVEQVNIAEGDCDIITTTHVAHGYADVASSSDVFWCGEYSSAAKLTTLVVQECKNAGGTLSADWCYDQANGKPLFYFYTGAVVTDIDISLNTRWYTSIITPHASVQSYDWLTFARGKGFLTTEEREYQAVIRDRLDAFDKQVMVNEGINEMRREIETHFANRSSIQGQYGVLVCQKDDRNTPLIGTIVGRVLATFEHVVQVQFVEYRGFTEPPATFSKGKVVLQDYRYWERCA